MTGLFDDTDDASTPLTPDERNGLLPTYIKTRGELNQVEQRGIFKAEQWAFTRRRNVLDEWFLRDLHRRMFREVWDWAGKLRLTERNIGIDAHEIAPALRMMVGDTKAQIEFNSYSSDEIAARFHVRLVAIHPFPNGNGRHGRLATDLLAKQLGREPFTWGGESDLTTLSEIRKSYIAAIHRAEFDHDYQPMMRFMRVGDKS
jgi:Fic-DOC domain mobile mystery protein B